MADDMQMQGEFRPGQAPDHEHTDVRIGGLLGFLIGLVVLTVASQAILAGLMGWFDRRHEKSLANRPYRYVVTQGQYPGPNLQDNPAADMDAMRREYDEALNNYGWRDRKAGVAKIPIGRAMEILAARGLPTQTQSGDKTSAGAGILATPALRSRQP